MSNASIHECFCRVFVRSSSLKGNEIFEFNATSGDNIHEGGNPLLRGHAAKELWGLSCNPSAPEFCTVGEDKQLRIWDIYSKRWVSYRT